MKKIIEDVTAENIDAAKTAAILAAGNVANKQLAKLAASKSPMLVRGYIDTPIGKLVIANIVSQLVKQTRPTDAKLQALAEGMIVSAYQDVINTVDIDGLIEEFLGQTAIKRALASIE